jgi:transposase-like protein
MKSAEFKKLTMTVSELDHHQRKRLMDTLSKQSDETQVIEVIESSFDSKKSCPHCHSVKLYRFGVVSGLQRYRCRDCQKTFNALTKTPLARLRNKRQWLTYLEAMAQSRTVHQSAADTKVHRNTSFRWRHRFLKWISQDRPTLLHGITEVDETHILDSEKGKKKLIRKPRKRGGTASKRGISNEQVCVLVARDRSGQTVDFVIGTGALSKFQLTAVLKPVLDADVLLVSDANPTYAAFCQSEDISHESVNLSKGQRVKGAFHVQNVNAYHSRFKEWLQHFHGVATHYLPNYLGWRRFLEKHSQPTPETFLNAALGNFQYLTVT